MATWGDSTAGNLESIEEDENHSGDGQDADCGDDDGKGNSSPKRNFPQVKILLHLKGWFSWQSRLPKRWPGAG